LSQDLLGVRGIDYMGQDRRILSILVQHSSGLGVKHKELFALTRRNYQSFLGRQNHLQLYNMAKVYRKFDEYRKGEGTNL
jgi:hypothetical protein